MEEKRHRINAMATASGLLKTQKVLIFDGAMGTNLLAQGLKPGESPSILNLRRPGAVRSLHAAYVAAGSQMILTNTFSAHQGYYAMPVLRKVIAAGVSIARTAAGTRAAVVADVSPFGELLVPYGKISFEKTITRYCELFAIYRSCGLDTVCLETFTSLVEAKAAFIAARNYFKYILISISLEENGHTVMGESPESFAVLFDGLGAAAIGINCTAPDTLLCALEKMRHYTDVPLMAKPNAGRVRIVGNKVKQTLSGGKLASYCERYIRAGARVIGGCCGTDPDYIKKIKDRCAVGLTPRIGIRKRFALCSARASVSFEDGKTYIVGERLNPSGRKSLRESIAHRDFKIYGAEAAAQEGTGAAALDVNAFIAGGNEKENLQEAVYAVSAASSLPLFIDTQDYAAARAVISRYPGIGVFNSVPAREKELRLWLPMLRYYGFKAVISLVGTTIPKTHSERMKNVRLALKIALQNGFRREDVIFDPLVFSLATDPVQVKHTLHTVQVLSRRRLKTILGISNISFGLPRRHWLNAVMAHEAIRSGIDFLILNTENEPVMNTVIAVQALIGGNAIKYINAVPRLTDVTESITKGRLVARQTVGQTAASIAGRSLITAVVEGDGAESIRQVKDLIKRGVKSREIIDEHVIKALQTVGDRYEKGIFFVPDLLRSADAAKRALDVVKKSLPKTAFKHSIVLATVKGDIHDIGKNIAAMVFESAGYKVIDLGKDVTADRIISAVRQHRPCALGLSALLTTTMPEMARVIEELRRNRLKIKVIIGGPNVSDAYARQIGAFGAAKSAMAGLKIVGKIQKVMKG